jgi:hypothetical protein
MYFVDYCVHSQGRKMNDSLHTIHAAQLFYNFLFLLLSHFCFKCIITQCNNYVDTSFTTYYVKINLIYSTHQEEINFLIKKIHPYYYLFSCQINFYEYIFLVEKRTEVIITTSNIAVNILTLQ